MKDRRAVAMYTRANWREEELSQREEETETCFKFNLKTNTTKTARNRMGRKRGGWNRIKMFTTWESVLQWKLINFPGNKTTCFLRVLKNVLAQSAEHWWNWIKRKKELEEAEFLQNDWLRWQSLSASKEGRRRGWGGKKEQFYSYAQFSRRIIAKWLEDGARASYQHDWSYKRRNDLTTIWIVELNFIYNIS